MKFCWSFFSPSSDGFCYDFLLSSDRYGGFCFFSIYNDWG